MRVKLQSVKADQIELYTEVEDTGVGISEAGKNKLFKVFTFVVHI